MPQLPAGSKTTICWGRSTDRKPRAIHLAGNTDPTTSIHPGSDISGTYVPGTNWRATAGPLVMTAPDTASPATLLTRMPSSEQLVMPRTTTHASVNQP